MNRWATSRRNLLKQLGAGAAMLPLLNATRSARAAAGPRRAIFVISTNGLPTGTWNNVTSSSDLSSVKLPDVLSPLEAHKRDLLIFPELANPGYTGAGHGAYGTVFSPGPNNPAEEYWTPAVPTIDQVCGTAASAGASLAAKTLPLQIQPDSGESRLGAYRCFFSGSNQAVTPETDPYKLSTRLFAGKAMGDPAADKLRAERKSMLDFVAGDLTRFGRNLGKDDRAIIENHLQSVRDIENQLAGVAMSAGCSAPNLGAAVDLKANDNYPALLKVHTDLALAALRCDYTRVVTMQLGNAFGGGVTFSWLGIDGKGLEYPTRQWHDVAHREMRDGMNDKLTVDKWFFTQMAYLIDGLKKSPEGGGSMFDNTVIVWANHMETGGGHNAMKLPWILAGSAGGYFKTGQLLRPAKQIAKTRVMCDVANALGANLPFLGDAASGTPIPELRAG